MSRMKAGSHLSQIHIDDRIDTLYWPWVELLFKSLMVMFPLRNGLQIIPADDLIPPDNPASLLNNKSQDSRNGEYVTHRNQEMVLMSNQRITAPDHFQDVRHLVFEFTEEVDYGPGDTISIEPKNAPKDVDAFLTIQDWENIADLQVSFRHDISPGTMTLRKLVSDHLDIMSIPRRSFFDLVRHFTTNALHKEKLTEFSKVEGQEELFDYANRPRRSILETLAEFDSIKIPIEYVLEIIPLIAPRQFSIANFHRREAHLAVAIVKYRTILRRIRRGVCTHWLEHMPVGTKVPFTIQHGQMRKCEDPQKPIVMVGPGTGVAPLRSLLQERISSSASGENVLFFGCRFKKKDFLFQLEMEDLCDRKLLRFFTAFSRDDKVYVQDIMRGQAELLYETLYVKGGVMFVCGSSGKMPSAVKEALVECFMTAGGMSRSDADAYLLSMESSGRYRQETW